MKANITFKQRAALLLLTVLCSFTGAWAQSSTLTVYEEGTNNNAYVPFYGLYADTQGCASECVIPSDQLTDMKDGTITAMKFYLRQAASEAWTSTHKVYLGEVAETTLTGITGPDAFTVVATASFDATGTELEITFDEPYTYGGGNLLIGTYVSVAANYKSAYFYGVNQEENTSWYRSSSSATGSGVKFIPKTTFTYVAVGGVVYSKPTALAVSDLTTTGTTISWTAPAGSPTGYVYQYKKVSEENWSAEATTTEPFVALTGLTQGTNYNFRVKAVYGSDGESGFATIDFTTDCGTFSLPYEEGFESGLGCWSLVECHPYTGVATGAQHDGNVGFYFNYSTTPPQYLISPEFDGTSAMKVSFWYKNYSSDYSETFQVGYSITDNDPDSFTWGDEITASNTTWTLFEGEFPKGTKYVAIKYTSDNQYYLLLDDFNFTAFSGVFKPTNLTASAITTNSATLSWGGTHDSYKLQYRPWTQVGNDATATATMETYNYDLSAFSGKTGSIAIRHYDVTDMFVLMVDDIVVKNGEGTTVFSEDFESCEGNMPGAFSNIDLDGDGYVWTIGGTTYHVNGNYGIFSESYSNDIYAALTPDNWLIISGIELGGTLSFAACGQDATFFAENFAVYVSPDDSFTEVSSITANSYNATGLEANTPYTWQVKGIKGSEESGWASSMFKTLDDLKVFTTDGDWNVAANWSPAGVPTADNTVRIDADAVIPAGYVALAKKATIGTGSITIKDGAELKQGSTLKVTMLKEIVAASNGFITSPINGRTLIGHSGSWGYVDNLDDGDFDFYAFDATAADGEWINYEYGNNSTTHDFFYNSHAGSSILWGEGYFYANDAATTLEFTGTTWSSSNNSMTKDVTYDGSSTSPYNGWRLIGNPYTCTAYVRYLDSDDNQTTATFYKLNAAGDGYDVYNNDISLAPCEAAFIKVTASGKILYSSEDLGGTISKTGTATAPYLPALGLAVNQGASNPNIVLANASSNATTLTTYNEETFNVILKGRTLVKNDSWNTLCLPFDLTLAGSILEDAEVKTLNTTDTKFADNTLKVRFTNAPDIITAGTPFIVKWASGSDIENPVFNNVIINNVASPEVSFTGGKFVGTFSPTTLAKDDMSLLYFGAANKLYWPSADVTLNSFRAYFDLDDTSTAPNIVVDFGDGATGIEETVKSEEIRDKSYYNLNGQKVERPTSKGVYIVNGRKVVLH